MYSREFSFHKFLNIITSNVIQTISRLDKIILNTVLLWNNNTLYFCSWFLMGSPSCSLVRNVLKQGSEMI